MPSAFLDSDPIDLLTRGLSYPLMFAQVSVDSKVMEDGQPKVIFTPLETEGIYEKLVEDVKHKKITWNIQVRVLCLSWY